MTLPQEHVIYVREIANHPDDDGPRLIYADWLEEHSNPRGEFIRIQCNMERLDPTSADYHDLNVRNLELLGQHRDDWISELIVPSRQRVFFRRGFIRHFKASANELATNGDKIAQLAPLTSLHLLGVQQATASLANASWLDHVHDLRLDAVSYDAKKIWPALNPVLQSSHLKRLRSLKLSLGRSQFDARCFPLLERHADSLQSMEFHSWQTSQAEGDWKNPMPQLRRLLLDGNVKVVRGLQCPQLSSVHLARIESSNLARELEHLTWANVKELALSHCHQAAMSVLREFGAFENTQRLRLHNCHVPSFANKLFRRTSLTACTTLEVERSNHDYALDLDAFVHRLLKHPLATRLKRLKLPHLNTPAAQAILYTPIPLEELCITQSVLHASPGFLRGIAPTLKSLSISDSTVEALHGIEFPQLRRLELTRCNYGDGDRSIAHLLGTTSFPELTELQLVQCDLGSATLRALAESSDCEQLRVLNFAENEATPHDIDQLLCSPRVPNLRRVRLPIYKALKKYSPVIRAHGPRLQYTERNEAGFYGL